MNKLLSLAAFRCIFGKRTFPVLSMTTQRYFSTESSMSSIINNFYTRGEAEELTVSTIAKTMSEMLKTHISFGEHKDFSPVSDELALYVIKLLQQHKKPFVSH
jgi:hypothetical protein